MDRIKELCDIVNKMKSTADTEYMKMGINIDKNDPTQCTI